MKFFRVLVLSLITLLVVAYLTFLLVLPRMSLFHEFSSKIEKIVKESSCFEIDLSDFSLKTSWDFSVIASARKADLKYDDGQKFAQINNPKVKLSLGPLIRRTIKIDKFECEKLFVNFEEKKFNREIESIGKIALNDFKLDSKMPDVVVPKYRLSLIDNGKNYVFKGVDFKVSDFELNKKIKIQGVGKLVLNDVEQVEYKILLDSKVFPDSSSNKFDFMSLLDQIYKYRVCAKLDVALKVDEPLFVDKNKEDSVNIVGKVGVKDLSFVYLGKKIPRSVLNMEFKGERAQIDSNLYISPESKANIVGFFNTGKHRYVDLHVKTDKLNISEVYSFAKIIYPPIKKTDLNDLNVGGFLVADFNVKSDLRKIQSNGFLKISDAKVSHKSYKVLVDRVNANVDFSNNSIKLNKASAFVNSQPITIKGGIDRNAVADILVSADSLTLKSLLFASGQLNLLKENDIQQGDVDFSILLKGVLNKAVPDVKILVKNVVLKNKKTKVQVKVFAISVKSKITKNTKTVRADLSSLSVKDLSQNVLSLPKASLEFGEKDLVVAPTTFYINNIKAVLSGKIINIKSAPEFDYFSINLPAQISVPIKGYSGSKIVAKGGIKLSGFLNNPKVSGMISIPLISIPSLSTTIKNTIIKADKEIFIDCPNIKLASSLMKFSGVVSKDFSKGIVLKDVLFQSDLIDLNALGGVLKAIPVSSSGQSLTIVNGKNKVSIFKVGNVISSNVASDISMKNNILYLNNLLCDAYFGKIAGNIKYNLITQKTELNLQGRGLNSNTAMTAMTGINNDIIGRLDFDSKVYFLGHSKNELLRTLNGNTVFIISDGKMGLLGKFEHLIYAQNILSNSIFKSTLNLTAKALSVKNTGVYRYMKGKISLANGFANIEGIKTSGPSMSLYITGRYSLLTNMASLILLGRISDDVVNVLGPIGEFSFNKALSVIPKFGQVTNSLINQYTINKNYENTSQIPPLSTKTSFSTKEFKVVIDGDTQKQSSVKSFKWIAKPTVMQSSSRIEQVKPEQEVPEFVKNLPNLNN